MAQQVKDLTLSHYGSSVHCYSAGSIPGPETSTCLGYSMWGEKKEREEIQRSSHGRDKGGNSLGFSDGLTLEDEEGEDSQI